MGDSRSDFIRMCALTCICDDYENLPIIWKGVTQFAWALRPVQREIEKAIEELIRDGCAHAYDLEPTPDPPSPVRFEMSEIEDLWYYATPKGLEQNEDEKLWREVESRISVTADLVGWKEIRNLRGELLFQLEKKPGMPDFKNVDLREANMRGLDVTGIPLDYCNLAGADLQSARLYWSVLLGANLEGANLEGTNLKGANLNSANCRHANLRNADIGQDDLGGASMIYGADFTDANLSGTIFENALYDAETKFPAGFAPPARRRYDWRAPQK